MACHACAHATAIVRQRVGCLHTLVEFIPLTDGEEEYLRVQVGKFTDFRSYS